MNTLNVLFVCDENCTLSLMAEAIHFFEEAQVLRILLNTQDDNTHAHRLYEWFGFIRTRQVGFVLRKLL